VVVGNFGSSHMVAAGLFVLFFTAKEIVYDYYLLL